MLLTLGEMGAVYLDKSWKKMGLNLSLREETMEMILRVQNGGWPGVGDDIAGPLVPAYTTARDERSTLLSPPCR